MSTLEPTASEMSRLPRESGGIYGLIITASVIATGGSTLSTAALVVGVVSTLVVYWLAEQYAEISEHMTAGHLPTWGVIGSHLAAKWPLVTASFVPLAALLTARVLGASAFQSSLVGLFVTVGLLMVYGWRAGRAAGLVGFPQVVMTVVAGTLGILMVFLKMALGGLH